MNKPVTADVAGKRDAQAVKTVCDILAQRFGEQFQTSAAMREQHAHTMTFITAQPPDGVLFAQSAEDVQTAVKTCAAHGVPVIAFGTGTSLEGNVNAPLGGISIDLTRMDRVVAVHPDDLD